MPGCQPLAELRAAGSFKGVGDSSCKGVGDASWVARVSLAMVLTTLILVPRRTAFACDICAIYVATEQSESRTGLRLGVAEQLSRYSTLQLDGERVDNPAEERLTSSNTQLFLGYQLLPRLGLQLNLPIISRTFRRLEEGSVVHDDETGIGDLSLIGSVTAYTSITENSVMRFSLIGGVKFPTGDSSRLSEELEEGHHDDVAGDWNEDASRFRRERVTHEDRGHQHDGDGLQSGIHGHDLALGSGSYDGIFGGQLFWSYRRWFLTLAGQYALRSTGDFDYRYADELTWRAGPGGFVLLGHGYSLGAQALVTGETKGKDTLDGVDADDTAITSLYLGPGLSFTWGTSFQAEISAELPVLQNNSALQLVSDFRLRSGIIWRF